MNLPRRVALMVATLALLGTGSPTPSLRGFTPTEAVAERALEAAFLDVPSAAAALADATAFAGPRAAGSAADHDSALRLRDRLRADAIDADIEPLRAEVDVPRTLTLALAPPAALAATPTPRRRGERLAAFPVALDLHDAFEPGSADGDVRAPLVFAGHGLDGDYATLASANVDVHGSVVLIRTGGARLAGIAARAHAHGAAGIILFADPADAGADHQGAGIDPDLHLPVVPVSMAQARTLLDSLQGPAGPPGWSGSLPVAYPLARGPGRVHLVIKLERRLTTAWNVVGVIPGTRDDQSVIVGGRRDRRETSGLVTLLEIASGLGYLRAGGWQPQRTIVIAGWGGDDTGAAGPRAFANRHWLDHARTCVAYLDVDRAVSGPTFIARASPALAGLALAVSEAVPDPTAPSGSILSRWIAQSSRRTPTIALAANGDADEFVPAQPGTPALSMRFERPRTGSAASDSDFSLHRAAIQLAGLAALRLADGGTVPYVFAGYPILLREATARLASRAGAAGIQIDVRPLDASIERLAAAVAGVDRRFGLASDTAMAVDHEVRAARELDALVADNAGQERPDNDDDAAHVTATIEREIAAVDRATNDLTF